MTAQHNTTQHNTSKVVSLLLLTQLFFVLVPVYLEEPQYLVVSCRQQQVTGAVEVYSYMCEYR